MIGQDFKAVENLNPVDIATDILTKHASETERGLTAEEFQVWAVKNSLPDDFNKLLFQVSSSITVVQSFLWLPKAGLYVKDIV